MRPGMLLSGSIMTGFVSSLLVEAGDYETFVDCLEDEYRRQGHSDGVKFQTPKLM
jgi:hypothetical protein